LIDTVHQERRSLSMASLESTLRKLSRAYVSMEAKGANLTLIAKRRSAVRIGVESLDSEWHGGVFPYPHETIVIAKEVLRDCLPSIEAQLAKARKGSAQHTLNERRLDALNLAIASLEERLSLEGEP